MLRQKSVMSFRSQLTVLEDYLLLPDTLTALSSVLVLLARRPHILSGWPSIRLPCRRTWETECAMRGPLRPVKLKIRAVA